MIVKMYWSSLCSNNCSLGGVQANDYEPKIKFKLVHCLAYDGVATSFFVCTRGWRIKAFSEPWSLVFLIC